jgi:hypothetical protein
LGLRSESTELQLRLRGGGLLAVSVQAEEPTPIKRLARFILKPA